jgi:hypothetical protein
MIFDFGLPIADWRSATLLEEKFRGREFSGLCFQNQKSEIRDRQSKFPLAPRR